MSSHDPLGPPTKWFPDVEASLPAMSGKTVAITGTTSGTGFVAARTCIKTGATVYALNRPSSRAETALAELQQFVGSSSGTITQIECDLTSFASVRAAAKKLAEAVGDRGLNILAHNAGAPRWPPIRMLVPTCRRPSAHCHVGRGMCSHLARAPVACVSLHERHHGPISRALGRHCLLWLSCTEQFLKARLDPQL